MNEKNASEILTVCVVHFTIHRNSLKCARKSNHTVVHFVLFHEFEIVPTICMVGTRMITESQPHTWLICI